MIDINEQMLQFKEAVRHVWNTYFADAYAPMSPETQEAFSDIERSLLRVLVLAPHGMGDIAKSYRLRVLPNVLLQPTQGRGEMSIQFGNKQSNGNVVWDMETTIHVDENTSFQFFDFFDWAPYGHVDLPFLRVRASSPAEMKGKIALIQQRHCKFILVPEGAKESDTDVISHQG